jgi:hypothetical protein
MYNFNYDGSKFKLQIFHERYFVNEEKRTVTVKAEVRVFVPDFILRTISPEQLPEGFSTGALYPFGGVYGSEPLELTATARCAPEDEFDVDKGKKIALAKLEAAAYERFVYALVNWNAELQRFTESVNKMTRDFVVKGAMTSQHNWKYIDDITGVEEEASDV